MSDTPAVSALVAEAARKSRVCWLSYDHAGGPVRSRLVWHVWHADAVVVVSGDEGQLLDGIGSASTGELVLRSKDTGGRLVTCAVRVEAVAPGSELWEELADVLLGVRLNLADRAATLEAWRREATIVRLTPAPETVEAASRPLP